MLCQAQPTTIAGIVVKPPSRARPIPLTRTFKDGDEVRGAREQSERTAGSIGNYKDSWVSPVDSSIIARQNRGSALGVAYDADVSLEKLLEEVRGAMVVDPEYARSAALRLVAMLSAPRSDGSRATHKGLAPWQLRKIDRYLADNLASPLRLQMLADQVNLSVSHFTRAFKESRGVTPHRYIIRLRLEKAQSMMISTDESLSGIASECGLSDQAHLTTLFRRNVGETPHAWRRWRVNEEGSGTSCKRDVISRCGNGIRAQKCADPGRLPSIVLLASRIEPKSRGTE
jgi:AraC family transcriptional regulator